MPTIIVLPLSTTTQPPDPPDPPNPTPGGSIGNGYIVPDTRYLYFSSKNIPDITKTYLTYIADLTPIDPRGW